MKQLSIWYVALIAVAAAAGLYYLPLLTALVVAFLFVVYREAEVKRAAAKGWTFTTSLLALIAVAIGVQIALTLVFGVSLKDLADAGGLPALFQDWKTVPKAAIKEVIALGAVIGIGYLWLTSTKPKRQWFIGIVAVSLGYLAWQAFDAYAPRNPYDMASRQVLVKHLREAGHRSVESFGHRIASALNRDSGTRVALIKNFEVIAIPEGAEVKLYTLSETAGGIRLANPEQAKSGSEWIWRPNSQGIPGSQSGMLYFRLVNRHDEDDIRYIDQLYLDEFLKREEPNPPTSAPAASVPKLAVNSRPVKVGPAVYHPPAVVKEVDREIIRVPTEATEEKPVWSHIWQEDGEIVEIWSPDGEIKIADLNRLGYCRAGCPTARIGINPPDARRGQRQTGYGLAKGDGGPGRQRVGLWLKDSDGGDLSLMLVKRS